MSRLSRNSPKVLFRKIAARRTLPRYCRQPFEDAPKFMRLENAQLSIRLIAAVTCLAFLASCTTAPQTARGPEYAPTASIMHEARSASVPVEKRAADYLQAAAMTAPLLGTGIGTPA